MYDDDVSTSIIKGEIESLKDISLLKFAPSLRRWNIEERWYEEDYMIGSVDASIIPPGSHAVLKRFSSDVAYDLKTVMLRRQCITGSAVEYVDDLIKTANVRRLSEEKSCVSVYTKIVPFIDSVRERLRVAGPSRVYLVVSHGDFCPENMLHTKRGLKVLDWEGTTLRSGLFDFYSYFFYRSASKSVPVQTLGVEINQALPCLISLLSEKASDMANSLVELEDVYRKLYYVERICMLVERITTDKNLNIMNHLGRYIEAFNCYEEMLVGSAGVDAYK
jgi:hypothetical protein